MPEHLMLLMCDILPTGYSSAFHARRLLDEDDDREFKGEVKEGVAVVIGCGPVSFPLHKELDIAKSRSDSAQSPPPKPCSPPYSLPTPLPPVEP